MSSKTVSVEELRRIYRLLCEGRMALAEIVDTVGEREVELPTRERCSNCGQAGHFPLHCPEVWP